MKLLFLCGGVGKRMFPLTEDKLLLKFTGKTLLEHQVNRAMQAGLNQMVIVGNPHNIDRIKSILHQVPGISAEFAVQEQALGIADALAQAQHLLDGEVLVVNPNDVFDYSAYTGLLQARSAQPALSYLLGYKVDRYFPGGYLVPDGNNDLQSIVEKPGEGNEPSDMVNILVHFHTSARSILEGLRNTSSDRDDVYECTLDSLIRDGKTIKVVPYNGYWSAIKYPWHIFPVINHFLDAAEGYISPKARIASNATVEGKVIIEDNVRILENAVVRGPVYIGANTIIGNNVLVRGYSHVGADCVVGYCTEIKGSYVGDRCWFHSTYVGDSVIADGCSFGAGTVLANFRFDEKNIMVRMDGSAVDTGLDKLGAMFGENSKTGVNVSILPGIRIGANSHVGPHTCLTNDLESNKIVLPEFRYRTMSRTSMQDDKKEELLKRLGDF